MIKLVCAWCREVLRDGHEPASHGICGPCKDQQLALLRAPRPTPPPRSWVWTT